VQQRLLRRQLREDKDDLSDADWPVFLELRRKAEPIRRAHVVLNTAADYETVLQRLLDTLRD